MDEEFVTFIGRINAQKNITIPSAIKQYLSLRTKDYVELEIQGHRIINIVRKDSQIHIPLRVQRFLNLKPGDIINGKIRRK